MRLFAVYSFFSHFDKFQIKCIEKIWLFLNVALFKSVLEKGGTEVGGDVTHFISGKLHPI